MDHCSDTLRRLRFIVLGASLAIALAACGGDGSDGLTTSSTASTTDPSTSQTAAALAIQGAAPAGVNYGSPYDFTPTVSAPAGAALAFTIQNKPAWAAFNTSNGALTGTPTAGDVGSDADIVISVSDGTASASLPAFSISVNEVSGGAATLDWSAVTETTADTVLTGLAGYIVYYGTSADNLNQQVKLANPGQTTYMVTNLAPATWYFGVAAYTSDGVIGQMSNVGEKTIP
jgi:hypothetical protein